MDLNTYMHIVDQMRRYQPAWRLGQTFSNVLRQYRPDLAKKMIGGTTTRLSGRNTGVHQLVEEADDVA